MLAGTEGLELELGPLTLRLRESSGEIRAAAIRAEGRPPAAQGGPGWTRWATGEWDGRVALTPSLPDRSVVVEPESAFRLAGGAEARIYVRVPLWVQLEALGPDPAHLARLPIVEASDTWWGTFEEGELCYWISTSARRAYDDTLFRPHLAMCPVQLVNGTDEPLPVEKVALRVAYLSLYADEGRIWTDETLVRYQGEADGSQIDVGGAPPPEASAATRIAPPRLRMGRGFRALTFSRLRALQGWV